MRHEEQTPEQLERAASMQQQVSGALYSIMADSDRSNWTQEFKFGVSDIGHCREYLRRLISREEFSDEQDDYSAAFMGTAVGALAEDAMVALNGGTKQNVVTVKLQIGDYVLEIPGHPDWHDTENLVDFKTKDGLGVVRRTGPDQQQRWQTTLYAKALIESGELEPDAWLHLVFIDRSGREKVPVVFSWQFLQSDVDEAMEWLADVIYALQHGEEASKDKPRDWCFSACPYATACRGTDTDVEGLILDPEVVEAKRIYLESNDIIKAAEKDKRSAMSVLDGRAGVVDGYVLRWTDVPESFIEGYTRRGYRRIGLKPITSAKRKG